MAVESRKSAKSRSVLFYSLGIAIVLVPLVSIFSSWILLVDTHNPSSAGMMISPATTAKRRFYVDEMCSNCRFVLSGPSSKAFTCQSLILRRQRKYSQTYTEAAQSLAKDKPYCSRCDPKACSAHEKRYWRMDAAAPKVQWMRTHVLQSIPPERRLPLHHDVSDKHKLRDYAASILQSDGRSSSSSRSNVFHNESSSRSSSSSINSIFHFYEFNPSIVVLPASQRPAASVPGAAYLASFRVSSQHNCVADDPELDLQLRGGSWPQTSQEYLGFAVLDGNLEILQETVVDAMSVMHRLQDARLFVLQDQIYVTTYHRVHAIWLRDAPTMTSIETVVLPPVWPIPSSSISSNITQPLEVTWRKFGSCTTDRYLQKGGKNLNYFVDQYTNETMLEAQPMGGKQVVDLQTRCQKSSRQDPPGEFIRSNATRLPAPSFATVDELDFGNQYPTQPPFTGERGSACCVAMEHNGQQLLLGISHSKTKFKHNGPAANGNKTKGDVESNHFFSNFYAMQAKAPYTVVARSGKFCLSGSSGKWNRQALVIARRRYDCPRIHFVSGMSLRADDPSQLIIAYGVNDCVPHMAVVDMIDVRRMLFAPETMR